MRYYLLLVILFFYGQVEAADFVVSNLEFAGTAVISASDCNPRGGDEYIIRHEDVSTSGTYKLMGECLYVRLETLNQELDFRGGAIQAGDYIYHLPHISYKAKKNDVPSVCKHLDWYVEIPSECSNQKEQEEHTVFTLQLPKAAYIPLPYSLEDMSHAYLYLGGDGFKFEANGTIEGEIDIPDVPVDLLVRAYEPVTVEGVTYTAGSAIQELLNDRDINFSINDSEQAATLTLHGANGENFAYMVRAGLPVFWGPNGYNMDGEVSYFPLSDFVVSLTKPVDSPEWRIFTDGTYTLELMKDGVHYPADLVLGLSEYSSDEYDSSLTVKATKLLDFDDNTFLSSMINYSSNVQLVGNRLLVPLSTVVRYLTPNLVRLYFAAKGEAQDLRFACYNGETYTFITPQEQNGLYWGYYDVHIDAERRFDMVYLDQTGEIYRDSVTVAPVPAVEQNLVSIDATMVNENEVAITLNGTYDTDFAKHGFLYATINNFEIVRELSLVNGNYNVQFNIPVYTDSQHTNLTFQIYFVDDNGNVLPGNFNNTAWTVDLDTGYLQDAHPRFVYGNIDWQNNVLTFNVGASKNISNPGENIYVYFGLYKEGRGLLYLTDYGLGVSSEKVPYAVISVDNARSLTKTITLNYVPTDFWSFRFPGMYRAVLSIETSDTSLATFLKDFQVN